jgi:GNAT superfamily N-acetyltransferase
VSFDRSHIEVVEAGPERLGALSSVFGRAFVNEPMMLWPMGEQEDIADRLTLCFSYFLERALGLGLVLEASVANGAAVWIPPRRFDSWESHPWNQSRIGALSDDGGRRYDAFWRWIDTRASDGPLWQLDSIAVRPDVQGRGYGATLISTGLERARSDGVGALLSTGTPRNVSIYERCGFRVVDEADAPDGGPHIWFMRWYPEER